MDDTILAYAAGTIDSDGCIQLMRRKGENEGNYSLRVSVSQVTESVPLWFVRNFGGKVYKFNPSKGSRQIVYRWGLESQKAADFLEKILPFLVEKIERAKVGIQYYSTVGYRKVGLKLPENIVEKRNSLYSQLKVLNANHSREYWKTLNNPLREKEI
jgi:hypothetical protein